MYTFDEIKKRENEEYKTTYCMEVETLRKGFFSQNTYSEDERFFYSCGGAVVAPLYVGFCEWVVETARQENIKLIMPLMREGMLYAKILEVIIKGKNLDIKVVPIWVSRSSSYYSLCYKDFDFDYFRELCFRQFRNIKICFQKLEIEQHKDIYEDDADNINLSIKRKEDKLIKQIYEEIVARGVDKQINERIKQSKELLSEYLEQCGATKDFITMDCGTLGTLPQAIDNCMPKEYKKIHLFLKAEYPVIERRQRGHDIRYLFFNSEESSRQEKILFSLAARYLYETITMGNLNKGTAIGYRKEGNEICVNTAPYNFDKHMGHKIDIMQESILKFCLEYMKIEQSETSNERKETLVENGLKSFAGLMDVPILAEVIGLSTLEFDESVQGENKRLIAGKISENAVMELPEGAISVYHQAVKDDSIWVQGALLLKKTNKKSAVQNRNSKKVAIYGCGDWGKRAVDKMQLYNVEIQCIIDKKMAGSNLGDYPIIAIEDLINYDVDDVIIASINFEEEMTAIVQEYSKKMQKKYRIHSILV